MTDEIVTELLPCPRCGGKAEIEVCDVEPQGDPWYGKKVERFVLCACGLCLFDEYFHDGFVTDAEAIDAWNTRSTAQEPALDDDAVPVSAQILMVLGFWRDKMPSEAVRRFQEIAAAAQPSGEG